MKRHVRYRRAAFCVITMCFVLGTAEAYDAVKYHFPWWDDLGGALTFILGMGARFVIKKTDIYSGVE